MKSVHVFNASEVQFNDLSVGIILIIFTLSIILMTICCSLGNRLFQQSNWVCIFLRHRHAAVS